MIRKVAIRLESLLLIAGPAHANLIAELLDFAGSAEVPNAELPWLPMRVLTAPSARR